jgi:hypothetical protein
VVSPKREQKENSWNKRWVFTVYEVLTIFYSWERPAKKQFVWTVKKQSAMIKNYGRGIIGQDL